MREDEACRFLKTEELFFVLQDEVVSRNIGIAVALGIDGFTFLVNGEITLMNLLRSESAQIFIIFLVIDMIAFG